MELGRQHAGGALVGVLVTLTALLSVPPAAAAVPPDLPAHTPNSATSDPPAMPEPPASAWPFPGDFPETSGTGRLDAGASLWSDFLFDDFGASPLGVPISSLQFASILAPAQGYYGYSDPAAKNNGADIFRSGVAADASSTYWRVDWNRLADPKVPIAEWALDTDSDPATGSAAWPGDAGIRSAGIEEALLVSSRGAWLIDPATGARTDVAANGGALTVDPASRSFIVRIPRTLLPVSGKWRVRLASGVAGADGTGFAVPTLLVGGLPLPGLPRAYNVTFRSVAQEPPIYLDGATTGLVAAVQQILASLPGGQGLDAATKLVTGNFWMEDDQADTLAGGDVSKFSREIDWTQLDAKATTPEPRPTGYSVRWYTSRFDLGGGKIVGQPHLPIGSSIGDERVEPTYRSLAQPYAVYVPTTYDPSDPAPLTWVLHSLEANYNQYGGLDPRLMQQLCEQRGSICATTEGYGPAGGYHFEGETDFWQVWRELADSYSLDPEQTVISGYSMGGFGTGYLGLAHPDLFSGAMVLDGSGESGDRVLNGRWVPFVIDNTLADELAVTPAAITEAQSFDERGLRYQLFIHLGTEHLGYAAQDVFDDAVNALGPPRNRKTSPGLFDYMWDPKLDSAELGTGATGIYWLDDLAARDPNAIASIHAVDRALPDPTVAVKRNPLSLVTTSSIVGFNQGLTWEEGPAPAPAPEGSLDLRNVAAASVSEAAKLAGGALYVTTDGPTRLSIGGAAFDLGAGTHELDVPAGGPPPLAPAPQPASGGARKVRKKAKRKARKCRRHARAAKGAKRRRGKRCTRRQSKRHPRAPRTRGT